MKINSKKLNFFCNFLVFYHFNFSVKVSYTRSFNTFTTTDHVYYHYKLYSPWTPLLESGEYIRSKSIKDSEENTSTSNHNRKQQI